MMAGTGRVAPGGLIHTGGSVVDTASDATQLNTPRALFTSLVLGGHRAPPCSVAWIGDTRAPTGSHDCRAKVWGEVQHV